MKENLAFVILLTGLLLLTARFTVCCAPSAEAAYTGALLRCVDKAETLAESRECRRHVDGDYGVTVTVTKDGGK